MKKILFLSVILTAFLFFTASNIFACSCSLLPEQSLKQAVTVAQSNAKAVFSGKVLEIISNPNELAVKIKFKVDKVWKQNLPEEIIVFTGQGGGDCGYIFEKGKSYLVYAYEREKGKNELRTTICTRTVSLAHAKKDLKILGKGKKPTKNKY